MAVGTDWICLCSVLFCTTLANVCSGVNCVIKSFIIQLKFLCNANNDCVDSCDSNGDDVLLFLYHVNNKSNFLFSCAFSWRVDARASEIIHSRMNVEFYALVFFPSITIQFVFSFVLAALMLLLPLVMVVVLFCYYYYYRHHHTCIDSEWCNMLRMHVQFIILI